MRRNSRNAGGAELALWRKHNMFPKTEHNARMRAAEEFEHETKLPGRRNGALGAIGLKVYRYLMRLRGKKSGRLDPTIRWIADQVHHSRSAVAAALKRLKEHGFLDWIRRCQPVEGAQPDEQQTEQIANAYVLPLPASAAERVRRMLRRPSEFVRAVAERLARQRKLETSTVDEVIGEVQDPALRAILARVRASVDSANPSSGQTEAL
ncbi:replication protein A [Sphingomonas sp. GC_Shp_6]|uniref:replication protein A n=1 Tax=Sphingomonas sp. GC_Shp_6 TaxID=2937378 RepID=UPI002269F665|nr:replication protein A [Sphingomonas sp. GC_Shp_6]